VLLTSGYSAAAGAIPAESAALRYLRKPYNLTALAHVVGPRRPTAQRASRVDPIVEPRDE